MGSGNASSGIVLIVLALVGVSGVITLVTGNWVHWPPIALGILVGLWAVGSINR